MSGYAPDVYDRLRADADAIIARYPENPRSALGPILHLIQSEDGYVSARGIALAAEAVGATRSEVSAVATFYSQYRRHPNGEYNVGVCINSVCAVMGGDLIWEALTDKLGIGDAETTEDGLITLERLECNAACDFAPVMMVNWEFFDNQTPDSAINIVSDIQAGEDIKPTRGPNKVKTFKEISRVLAGFDDGLAAEGPSAGPASLLGRKIAEERGWTAPGMDKKVAAKKEAVAQTEATTEAVRVEAVAVAEAAAAKEAPVKGKAAKPSKKAAGKEGSK